MASRVILTGLSLVVVGIAGKYVLRQLPNVGKVMKERRSVDHERQYYRGGFDSVMNRREAMLILGINQTTDKIEVKEAFKRVMIANHPDRGGSPYIAMKINEAKDYLDQHHWT